MQAAIQSTENQTRRLFEGTNLSLDSELPKVGGDGLLKVRLVKLGKYVHKVDGPFQVTESDVADIIKNSNYAKPNVDYDHNSTLAVLREKTPSAGEIVEIENELRPPDENGDRWLWATAWLSQTARELVNSGEYRYGSPEIEWNCRDEKNNVIGTMVKTFALVNRPFWKTLKLSEDGELPPPIGGNMKANYNPTSGKLECMMDGETVEFELPEGFRMVPAGEPNEQETTAMADATTKPTEETTAMAEPPATSKKEEAAAVAAGCGTGEVRKAGEASDKTMLSEVFGKDVQKTLASLVETVNRQNLLLAENQTKIKTLETGIETVNAKQREAEINLALDAARIAPTYRTLLSDYGKQHGVPKMLDEARKLGKSAVVDLNEYGGNGGSAKTSISLFDVGRKRVDELMEGGKDFDAALALLKKENPNALTAYLSEGN